MDPADVPPAAEPSRPRTRAVAWALALGAVYFIVFGTLWLFVGRSETAGENDWVVFFGRFHFIFLHLPIGTLLVLGAIEVLGVFPGGRKALAASTTLLWFAAVGGVAATICGFLLSRSGGYGAELLQKHLYSGIAVVVGTLLALTVKIMYDHRKSIGLNLLYKTFLFATLVTLFFASHLGGSLTHGSDYLTKRMPGPLRQLVGLAVAGEVAAADPEEKPEEMPAYHGVIAPVLEEKCLSCHNEEKQKGDLRMDTFALLMKGGDYGPAVEPGDPEKSELYYRLTTDDEDERMPPEDKTPLTEGELAIIEWWIRNGASETALIKDLEQDDAIKAHIEQVLNTYKPKSAAEREAEMKAKADTEKAKEAEAKRAEELTAHAAQLSETVGVPILPVAQGEPKLQFTAVNVTDSFGDAQLAQLAPLAEAMVDVNLARTQITDAAMAEVAKMTNLERLRLENTAVSDAGLRQIEALGSLEYLNLYGTQVTDAGIAQLAGLKNLAKLFVWQTGVTREGAERLVGEIPGLVVNLGWDNEVPGPDPAAVAAAKADAEKAAENPQPVAETKPEPDPKPDPEKKDEPEAEKKDDKPEAEKKDEPEAEKKDDAPEAEHDKPDEPKPDEPKPDEPKSDAAG